MELNHETRKEPKFAPEDDVISRLPENVIANIMDRLPLQYAVRTGILSRNWRFKWTLLSQLVFDDNFFYYLYGGSRKYFDRTNISNLLLHLKGPITKFVLYVRVNNTMDADDINHWVMFLSKIGIKELAIRNAPHNILKLPTHLFSCLELKHLKLQNCFIRPSHSFCGFPNLLSLDLCHVHFENYTCGELIARCPLLESLKIDDHEPGFEVKLAEIAKIDNLNILSLSLCLLDNTTMIRCPSIYQQMSLLLPKLLELSLSFRCCKFLDESGTKKRVSTGFPYLKTLAFHSIDFSSDIMLSSAFEMIFGSPNLQTLHITATYENEYGFLPTTIYPSEEDYNKKGHMQLRSVMLTSIRGSVSEVCFIKCILSCSPLLKEMVISVKPSEVLGGDNGDRMFATKLLKLHRASPIAEIDLIWL